MTENPEKKIIVDEDWKSQVEREREAARKGRRRPSPRNRPQAESPEVELPPASLTYLASSLYFQASMFLGSCLIPAAERLEKNLPVAKHSIDMLEVLQQKTEGNRTPEESEEHRGHAAPASHGLRASGGINLSAAICRMTAAEQLLRHSHSSSSAKNVHVRPGEDQWVALRRRKTHPW